MSLGLECESSQKADCGRITELMQEVIDNHHHELRAVEKLMEPEME